MGKKPCFSPCDSQDKDGIKIEFQDFPADTSIDLPIIKLEDFQRAIQDFMPTITNDTKLKYLDFKHNQKENI